MGSEEDWGVHHSRTLPSEDTDKAGHQSRCEDYVWQRIQGEGKASKDHRESIPSGCIKEADLGSCRVAALDAFPEVCPPWESHGACLGSMMLALGTIALQTVHMKPSGPSRLGGS